MERIRQSEFTKFQRCPRSWALTYGRDLVPLSEGPRMPAFSRDCGSATHRGAEVIHNGGSLTEALSAVEGYVEEMRSMRNPDPLVPVSKVDTPEWEKVQRYALGMVEMYSEWLEDTGHDAGFETLGVELDWEVPIPGLDAVAYGAIDLYGRDALRGGTTVDDLKTVDGFSNPPMAADFQLRTYAWAMWRTTGEVPVAAGHRMIKRVLMGGTAKGPKIMYAPIHIDEMILRKHEEVLIVRAKAILEARSFEMEDARLYPVANKDCSWDCNFRSVCPMIDEEDDWESVLELNFTLKSDAE